MKEKERDQEKREVQGRSASAVGKAVGIAVGKMMGKTAGYSSENTARNTAADAARRKLGAYVLTAAVWAAGAAAGTAAGAAAWLGFGAETVWAAEDRTPIQSIELNIDSDIEAGTSSSHVEITPRGEAHYQVGDIEVLNEEDDWYGGMTPRVSFSLFADHGYYFDGSSRSMFDFYGNDASYVTSRREDDKTTLVVTIKLDKLENGDLSVSGVEWDEGNGSALWEETPGAKYYQVRLYRDDKSVTGIRTTYDTYYEFAGEITRRGDYYFEVRAVGGGSEKGDWYSSDSWYVSSREADDISYGYDDGPGSSWSGSSSGGPGVVGNSSYGPGGPGAAGSGSYGPGGSSYGSGGPGTAGGVASTGGNHWCVDQRGWWYQYASGGYPVNCWELVDGIWYCFGQDGYLRCGWIDWNGKWYYTDASGAMLVNTRTPDGYYVGGDGAWIQ